MRITEALQRRRPAPDAQLRKPVSAISGSDYEIDLVGHPIETHPEYPEFVSIWNQYIRDPDRQALAGFIGRYQEYQTKDKRRMLMQMDGDFVTQLRGEMFPVFYALLFLHEDPEERDRVFLQKAKNRNLDPEGTIRLLLRMNSSFVVSERVSAKTDGNAKKRLGDLKDKVLEDTNRQLRRVYPESETRYYIQELTK